MKKAILILVILIISSFLLFGCTETNNNNQNIPASDNSQINQDNTQTETPITNQANTTTYSNNELNFSIEYPTGWEVSEDSIGIHFGAPNFRDNYALVQKLSLDFVSNNFAFKKLSKREDNSKPVTLLDIKSNFPKYVSSLGEEVVSTEIQQINGNSALVSRYNIDNDSINYHIGFLQTYIIQNDSIYIIGYAAPAASFNDYSIEANSFTQSFKTD